MASGFPAGRILDAERACVTSDQIDLSFNADDREVFCFDEGFDSYSSTNPSR
jgi:hypothetical protein